MSTGRVSLIRVRLIVTAEVLGAQQEAVAHTQAQRELPGLRLSDSHDATGLAVLAEQVAQWITLVRRERPEQLAEEQVTGAEALQVVQVVAVAAVHITVQAAQEATAHLTYSGRQAQAEREEARVLSHR